MNFGSAGAVLLAVALSSDAFADTAKPLPGANLATPEQKALDARTVRIFNDPAFQKRLREAEALFLADPLATSPEAKKMIAADAAAIAFNELQVAVVEAAEQPAPMWTGDAPHRWFGMDVPFASYGLNNPDNIYRMVPIDGAARYVISGREFADAPAQTTYFLYNSIPGDGTGPIDGPIDGLLGKDIRTEADGTFTIAIDSDAPDGKINHIRSRADAKLLIIRESMADWTHETPAALTMKRVAGTAAKPPTTDAAVADRALDLQKKLIAFWLKYASPLMFNPPANTVGKPNARGGKWGYTANGNFRIAADEALLVTIDPASAAYVGFQLADAWAIPFEFVHHLSSLTNGQATPNPDGTITYVIAAKDPGVHNWLDTTGFLTGVFGIRWQNLTDDSRMATAVRDAKRVKLSELAAALPPGTAKMTPGDRAAQIAARTASWDRRLR
jgi:hypothetical protein